MKELPEEFENIYKRIKDINIPTQSSITLNPIFGWTFAIAFFVLLFAAVQISGIARIFLIALNVILVVVMVTISNNSMNSLISFGRKKEKYKREIMPEILKGINENLRYRVVEKNDKEILDLYKRASFDDANAISCYVKDCIEGNVTNEISIKIVDSQVKKEYYSSEGQYFSDCPCIFAYAYLENNFTGTMEIISEQAHKAEWEEKREKERKDKVEIDNTDFERKFNVYCANKILAMRVLTSDIIYEILDLYNYKDIPFNIFIRNNEIYVILDSWARNRLENGIEISHNVYCDIKLILEVIKKLNEILKETEE